MAAFLPPAGTSGGPLQNDLPAGGPVLWIRIRSDQKLFAGSRYVGDYYFGSGSDELQFLVTKIA